MNPFLWAKKKINKNGLEEKEEKASRKFKNEQSTGQVMLMIFYDWRSLMYAELAPDASKEKQNVTQDTYFNNAFEERDTV